MALIRGNLGTLLGPMEIVSLAGAYVEGGPAVAVSSIAAFWAVAALLIAVPGADWAYVIGTVLSGRPVVLAVSGIVIGYAAITIVVAAGVGALVARTPASLKALTIAGGLYLLWLGVRTFLRPAGHGPAQGAAARTDRATLVKG